MIYLLICLWFGVAGGVVGRIKGSSFLVWFMISAVVPVIGMLVAVFYRSERDEVRRQCPRCGSIVKLYDQVCMRCGEDMYFPDVAIEPEVAARR
jgi:ribosomal protein S27AE